VRLHYAAEHHQVQVAVALLEAGADPDKRAAEGTPLDVARQHNSFGVIELLERARSGA
jgi:ankyrin repeat protein